jgi:peptidoglycan/LPS O-acetylase OafA/YrhL
MLGFFRFYLALFVVYSHLAGDGRFKYAGGYAVFGFYIISGYLMTYLMNRRYGYSKSGMQQYAINRFLKIFPVYWLIAIVTLISLLSGFVSVHPAMRLPSTAHEIFSNIFILGLSPSFDAAGVTMARLVPPAWALHVELCFYIAIGLFLGRSKQIAVAWFAVASVYHAVAWGAGWERYSSLMAASLPFSVGALIFHFGHRLSGLVPRSELFALCLLFGYPALVLVAGYLPMSVEHVPAYLNIGVCAVLVVVLKDLRIAKFRRLDEFLGGLSYPIYLTHWLIGSLLAWSTGTAISPKLFVMSLPAVLVVSVAIARFIDRPLNSLRATASSPASQSVV